MNYRFATEDENYEDYSSGRVLYNQAGATAFPVRLASEIFQICTDILKQMGKSGPYNVYDPCCGGAYILTTLAIKHGCQIKNIYASDIEENIISLAQKNLSLASIAGLSRRMEQIREMAVEFGKKSHMDAIKSAERLKDIISERGRDIGVRCFIADITETGSIKCIDEKVDIVITDLPYGDIVSWHGKKPEDEAAGQLLDNLIPILSDKSVIAVVSNKKNKVSNLKYKRLQKIQVGKRKIEVLQLII